MENNQSPDVVYPLEEHTSIQARKLNHDVAAKLVVDEALLSAQLAFHVII
jgi:hypothetical protein